MNIAPLLEQSWKTLENSRVFPNLDEKQRRDRSKNGAVPPLFCRNVTVENLKKCEKTPNIRNFDNLFIWSECLAQNLLLY